LCTLWLKKKLVLLHANHSNVQKMLLSIAEMISGADGQKKCATWQIAPMPFAQKDDYFLEESAERR